MLSARSCRFFGGLRSVVLGLVCLAVALGVCADTKNVKLDPNGGKVTPNSVTAVEGETFSGLPDATLAKTEFDGWWTAKDGGVQVQNGDTVDFAIFANAKAPTLYAQWRKPRKITVSGGKCKIADDDTPTTSKSELSRGEVVSVEIDSSKLVDKNNNQVNAFANWTYTPAAAKLGDGFDPFDQATKVMMPNADVKLAANFVNGFAAFLKLGLEKSGEAPDGDFYWSVDNGKTLIPFGSEFPVKAGKIKVKFFDKTGNWRAGDIEIVVDKRGTYKEGNVTYYKAPAEIYQYSAKFVPVNNSTKIKLDANGGSGSGEAFFANGLKYGSLPVSSRKGYVFAGWWTEKTGGKHVTAGTPVKSADFAGQKTPMLYAHWLQLKKLTMKDDSAYVEWSLDENDFDDSELYSEIVASLSLSYPDLDLDSENIPYLRGTRVLQVLPGARVSVVVDDWAEDNRGNELVFQKWTVSPSKANLGPDFRVTQYETEFTMPDADVTLQATYIDAWSADSLNQLSVVAIADPVCLGGGATIEPPYDAFEWSPDGGKTWYKASRGSSTNNWYGISWDEDYDYMDYDSGAPVKVDGEIALLKAGKYTITWRSNDPNWKIPDRKWWYNFSNNPREGYGGVIRDTFTYVPQVVVDVMTFENGKLNDSPVGGTVTMNPKDGLVPMYKTITLTAKAAKNYAFQGWAYSKKWNYGDRFEATGASWKIENNMHTTEGSHFNGTWFDQFIDPADKKAHIVAVFKALSAYSADDIKFDGFKGWYISDKTTTDGSGNASVTVKAVVGCKLDDDYALVCGPLASPLTYKLVGKLPDGLKFDAKTGTLSGAPKKPGSKSVSITASDPAKKAKSLTVNFEVTELPKWLVGEYRGLIDGHLFQWDSELTASATGDSRQCGIVELSVKSDGKVSGKAITASGSYSGSGSLTWYNSKSIYNDDGYNAAFAEYRFTDSGFGIRFYEDGTIRGHFAPGVMRGRDAFVGGDVTGMRQNTTLLEDCPFLDKYYTFAFCATNSCDNCNDEPDMKSGYGYLTLKADKKGVAKVTGQLPDGEKVSMSALVLPFVTNEVFKARLYVFASPSSYKKQDWFAMSMVMLPDGSIEAEDGAVWTPATSFYNDYDYYDGYIDIYWYYDSPWRGMTATVIGRGTLYSEAKSLQDYYWVSCKWSECVLLQYSYKDYNNGSWGDGGGSSGTGGGSYTEYDNAFALDVADGYFFNVRVKGDNKGAISLEGKSPAPWEESWKKDGVTYKEWNYEKDKNDKPITDPSQLTISFTKATGIFTGKANVYFDYWQPNYKKNRYGEYEDAGSNKHVAASLPYSGVMIYDGDGGYEGYGSAVHTYKYSYIYNGKTNTDTKKVTLPVSLK